MPLHCFKGWCIGESMKRTLKYSIFSTVYLVQGIILSYFFSYNIIYLAENGVSRSAAGTIQAIIAIPTLAKFLLAALSDRVWVGRFGRRTPFIFLGLVLQSMAGLAMLSTDPSRYLMVFTIFAVFGSVGLSLTDAAIDGLAMDTSEESEMGLVQGIMNGSRAGGIFITLLAGSWIIHEYGWHPIFFFLSLSPLLPLVLVLFIRETRPDSGSEKLAPLSLASIRPFTTRSFWILGLAGLLFAMTMDSVFSFWSDHLKNELGMGMDVVGVILAISIGGRVIGSLLSGPLTGRLVSPVLGMFLASAGITFASIQIGLLQDRYTLILIGISYGAFYALFNVAYGASAMKEGSGGGRDLNGFLFAIFMALVNFGTALGELVSGFIVDHFGFPVLASWMGVGQAVFLFGTLFFYERSLAAKKGSIKEA